jgi:hypothetical protein
MEAYHALLNSSVGRTRDGQSTGDPIVPLKRGLLGKNDLHLNQESSVSQPEAMPMLVIGLNLSCDLLFQL